MLTRRLRLREVLAETESGYSLDELAELMDVKRGVILSDLRHLQLSLRHQPEELQMAPPACGACGFTFKPEEPKAPSKCPSCKSRDIVMPVFRVARFHGTTRSEAQHA